MDYKNREKGVYGQNSPRDADILKLASKGEPVTLVSETQYSWVARNGVEKLSDEDPSFVQP